MIQVSINLSEELIEYLDSNFPHCERSEFINILIKNWRRKLEESKLEIERSKISPRNYHQEVIWVTEYIRINDSCKET